MDKKLLIIGAGETASIAYDYFTNDSEYEVVGFAVEKKYYSNNINMGGVKVFCIEDALHIFHKDEVDVFVAISYVQQNDARARLVEYFVSLGYHCASYISSKAIVHPSVKIGQNVFVFEGVVIQIGAIVKNNSFIWNGAQIAHRSVVGNNCWLAPGCVVAGMAEIGDSCFIGANATVIDGIKVPDRTVLGAGAVLVKNYLECGKMYVGVPARELMSSDW